LIHKIMTQDEKPKEKPESLASLQSKELAYWKGMNEAIAQGKNQGRAEYELRAEYARAHGQKRDLSPMVYRTTIGHYGGLYVEVPEEKFDDFRAIFPVKEFPRKVEHNDLHDAAVYHPEAAQHFHKVFPEYSGKTRTVYFANASKGEKRLDYYDLPHERETNPGNPGFMAAIGGAIGRATAKGVTGAIEAAKAAREHYVAERARGRGQPKAKPEPEPEEESED